METKNKIVEYEVVVYLNNPGLTVKQVKASFKQKTDAKKCYNQYTKKKFFVQVFEILDNGHKGLLQAW